MRIKIASIFVDDQNKALKFYTEKLGFIKKDDVPAGDFRWLTIVSADAPEGMELLLEPNSHKAAAAFQNAIFSDNIPATLGVEFRGSCRKLIQLENQEHLKKRLL